MRPVILWFRQDLRLSDHPALCAAAKAPIIPIFILDDETPGDWRWGGASRWWLHQSLSDLGKSLPLVLRRGRADKVLEKLLCESDASALYFTRDYAPWSGALEQRVKATCETLGVECHRHSGFLLHEPESIRTGSDAPYRVYTPFSRACFAKGEPRPLKSPPSLTFCKHQLASDKLEDWALRPTKPDWAKHFAQVWQPGEAGAKAALKTFIDGALEVYAAGRDFPGKPYTSRLSPHLHWGEISPHMIWHAISAAAAVAGGKLDAAAEKFKKEILWREFSYHLLHHWPTLPREPFQAHFSRMEWVKDDHGLQRWQQGKTGYPIVDAGMRELWATGIMHNRVRMIVASFLIKHLGIDWRKGQKWFWDCLVDADIASNAASWQWVAGCGADAAPYYRIFNPMLQGEKFDPDGNYVRRWVPELAHVPNEHLHAPWTMAQPPVHYPSPMVDHYKARDRAMASYQAMKSA